jgi:predicted ATP-dependent serine protease
LRRLNMLLAVLEKRAGFKLATKDVFLNIAGGIKLTTPASTWLSFQLFCRRISTVLLQSTCVLPERWGFPERYGR